MTGLYHARDRGFESVAPAPAVPAEPTFFARRLRGLKVFWSTKRGANVRLLYERRDPEPLSRVCRCMNHGELMKPAVCLPRYRALVNPFDAIARRRG